jgi:hypothetical protein
MSRCASQHFRDFLDTLGESMRHGRDMKPSIHLPAKRMLTKAEAASYCGFKSTAGFATWCPVAPVRIGSKVLYDLRAIDLWLDRLNDRDSSEPHRGFC